MELTEDEVESELYKNIFNSAEGEIKLHLMNKYDELKEQDHLIGKYNIYNYVFNNFQITSAQKKDLIFSNQEASFLETKLASIQDNFDIKEELVKAIAISKKINSSRMVTQ